MRSILGSILQSSKGQSEEYTYLTGTDMKDQRGSDTHLRSHSWCVNCAGTDSTPTPAPAFFLFLVEDLLLSQGCLELTLLLLGLRSSGRAGIFPAQHDTGVSTQGPRQLRQNWIQLRACSSSLNPARWLSQTSRLLRSAAWRSVG